MYRTNVYRFFVVLTCALLSVGCRQTGKAEKETGGSADRETAGKTENTVKTVRRHVRYSGAFYQITNIGSLDIVFTQGPYNIEAEGPENLIDDLSVAVDQYVLTVSMKDEEKIDLTQYKSSSGKLTLYVSSPTVKAIAVCGTGGLHVRGTLQTDDLQLGILGEGSIEADSIIAGNLSVVVTGDGNTSIRQVTAKTTAKFLLSGHGSTTCNIDAGEGVSVDCNSKCRVDMNGNTGQLYVFSSGGADCSVNFNADRLTVDATDGTIFVKGRYKTKSLNKRGNSRIFQS